MSLPLLAAALLFAAPVSAQRSEREIREDLAFARGLASDWQFVELAEGVLDEIDASRVSDRLKEQIGLTRCEVYASGAPRERDSVRQQELYEKALEAYRSYLETNRFAENRGEAERDLVDLANAYGQDLFRLFGDAVGDEATALREKIANVLTDAIGRTQDLIDGLQDQIDEEEQIEGATAGLRRERSILMLNRGQMLLTIAQVSEDGTYYFEQAGQTLEELAGTAGERTYFGLKAYSRLGEVYAAQGRYDDAADFLQFVVESTVPIEAETRALEGGFDAQPQEVKDAFWYFVDSAMGPLVDAYIATGDIEEACRWGLHFTNSIDRYGFTLSRPNGYFSMLAVARAMLDSGGYVGGPTGAYEWYQTREEMEAAGHKGRRNTRSALDLSLLLAQQVNRDNRGNILQLHSQKVIADIIERGVAVDPEVLFEAAQGAYYEERYSKAIEGFKRVLSVLETGDDATRARLGPGVLWHIGRSFQKDGRTIEAATAFRTGLEDRWKGDPKYDSENAKQYHKSITLIRSKAGDDPLIEAKFREAQDLVLAHQDSDQGAGDILFSQAKLAYDQKDYEDARERFLQVPGGANNYEKAVVYAAVSLNKLGDADQAFSDLEKYLEVYVKDPVKTPTTETALGRRQEAMGLARYYGGLILFTRAEAGAGSYDPVIEWLDSYAKDFPEQTAFAPKTLFMTLSAFLAKGDIPSAEARLERLTSKFPDSVWTGHGALAIYKVYDERREAAAKGTDTAALTRGMAQNLQLFNTLGGEPKLSYLRSESKLWLELEEWAEAEKVLARAAKAFGDSQDPVDLSIIRSFVLPDLAHAKLRQKKTREAAELLGTLMADNDSPSRQTAHDFCMATSGWVEGKDREIVEVAGLGGAENLERAAELLIKLAQSIDKWEMPWYELKFDLAYTYYQWGKIDGKKLESAKRQINQLQSDLTADLTRIRDTADGDDTLRQRFLWLLGKL
jgi:tetratricopeptide (TPR) repeat protein